jgi:hypothetical protein
MGTLGGGTGGRHRRKGIGTPSTGGAVGTPSIVVLTQPSATGQSGANLAQAPVLQLRDSNGNNLSQSGVVIAVGIVPAGTVTKSPTTLTTNASGTATITALSITATIGSYSLSFTSPGFTGAVSNPITIGAGAAAAATTTATVSGGTVGVNRTFTIQSRDSAGNACTTGGASVLVTITGANANSDVAVDNANGTYTYTDTPATAGTDTVAITLNGTAISGSPYTSTVSAASSTSRPNQPASMTQVFDQPWIAAPPLCPTRDADGWCNFTTSNTQVGTATSFGISNGPASSPNVLRINFPGTLGGGNSASRLNYNAFPANTGDFYLMYWVYIPSTFTYSTNPGGKVMFLRDGAIGGSTVNNHYTGGHFNANTALGTGAFSFGLQRGAVAKTTYKSTSALNAQVTKNTWHQVEWRGTANTPGVANGTLEFFFNGVRGNLHKDAASSQGIQSTVQYFESGDTPQWIAVQCDMTYGGTVAPPAGGAGQLYYDHWYMSVD